MTVVESVKDAVGLGHHGGVTEGGPKIQATREEMSAARLPLAYRDSCAHLLIPLNKCRYDNYYMAWRCMVRIPNLWREVEGDCQLVILMRPQDERHSYEKCQYDEFKLRVKKMDEIRAEKGGARSN
ncbi:hypothetical protein LTR85_011652 [Meristemomyces frigidus]|nr:hypothetical protein LTR85_011652 [Meristemomyces frigidus]